MEKTKVTVVEVGSEPEYVRRSDKEIKELALAVHAGSAFGTWSIPEHSRNMTTSVFMTLLFMGSIDRKRMKRDGIVHVYEFLSEAGPRSINGMPSFMSHRTLNGEDTNRLQKAIDDLRAFMGEEN